MGACTSSPEGGARRGKSDMRKSRRGNDNMDVMVLLLGAGSVGKTTLLKQLMLIEGPGFPTSQREAFIPVMQKNAVNSMQILVAQSDALGIQECEVSQNNRRVKEKLLTLKETDEELTPHLAQDIETLWRDPGIQLTYSHRSAYSLSDGAGYFLDKAKSLCNPSLDITDSDILRCNARTTGIVETEMRFENFQKFLLVDVGGQRHERRKWTHFLGNSKLVIFVADASGFDQGLVEDPGTNRLTEELNLFGGVCSMCPSRPIILIINKIDILKEKLENNAVKPVNTFHPTCPPHADLDTVLSWMKGEFTARNTNRDSAITALYTTAVDKGSAKLVIQQVKSALSENFG